MGSVPLHRRGPDSAVLFISVQQLPATPCQQRLDLVVQNLHFKALNSLYLNLNPPGKCLKSGFQIPPLMDASPKHLISARKMCWGCRGVDVALHREGIRFSLSLIITFLGIFGVSELELIKDLD